MRVSRVLVAAFVVLLALPAGADRREGPRWGRDAIQTADHLLAERIVSDGVPAERRPDLQWQRALLAASNRIVAGNPAPYAVARRVEYERRRLSQAPAPPAPPQSASPSAAAAGLAESLGLPYDPRLSALDTLPAETASGLTRLLDALRGLADAETAVEQVAARAPLLEAIFGFGPQMPGPDAPILFPPLLAIDPYGTDDVWVDDVALLIDTGGNDTYLNNAGGSDLLGNSCAERPRGAALLVDFAGNDRYTSGRSCGANGGGWWGAGMLVDLGGADVYSAAGRGANGGAVMGSGMLLDLGGSDRYTAGDYGVNGGGWDEGIGLLADLDGADEYVAGRFAGNGGGGVFGDGMLVDTADPTIEYAGNDVYRAGGDGTNGGGTVNGRGALVDGVGNDVYDAAGTGTNGGGNAGVGALIDLAGADTYTAGAEGTNGGAFSDGAGMLVDDVNFADSYSAGDAGTNGGAIQRASGLLVDGGGGDRYTAGGYATNGGAAMVASGALLDMAGNDTYTGGNYAVNGGTHQGNGLLADLGGDDAYVANGSNGTNGGVNGVGGKALLIDYRDRDTYREEPFGPARVDCSMTRGSGGALLDLPKYKACE